MRPHPLRPKNEVDAVAAIIDPYFLCYPARQSARKARYKDSRAKAAAIIKALDVYRGRQHPQAVQETQDRSRSIIVAPRRVDYSPLAPRMVTVSFSDEPPLDGNRPTPVPRLVDRQPENDN